MDLIGLLVYLVVAALIFYLIYWLIGQMPVPEPFRTVILAVMGLIAVIFLIGLLTGYVPMHLAIRR